MEKNISTKHISIILSKQNSFYSKGLFWITGRKYTHASIRLEEMGDSFYSFNLKGFSEEYPKLFYSKYTDISVMYQLEVSQEVYDHVRKRLEAMIENRSTYTYSSIGVFLCIMGISHRFGKAYFCSQFVAELLINSGALPAHRSPSLFLPNGLEKAIVSGYAPYNRATNVARALSLI
ncbi:MAG: hypothetical protein ACRCW1_03330 [Anaerotignaceae bacterium]